MAPNFDLFDDVVAHDHLEWAFCANFRFNINLDVGATHAEHRCVGSDKEECKCVDTLLLEFVIKVELSPAVLLLFVPTEHDAE